ncbi:MAG: HlyD family efflux transporter periplasmic adaptor subunit [Planctomycetes bacterium]|nr:HlyD family efflux transporter periplasmic adaptor subunit [Planctomycetota bacterium]
MRSVRIALFLSAVLLVFGWIVWVQTEGSYQPVDGKKKADDKPAVHRVEKKPFRVERAVKGILSPAHAVEISYRPLVPSSGRGELTIHTIVEHGSRVKAGDVLATFDAVRLDETIDALQSEQKSLKADIKLAEEELPHVEKSAPTELAAAETAKKRADEDLKYFLDTDRVWMEKSADKYVKSAKFYVEYAEEELRQLEKMYKANDLTEDTERIILRRQKNWVEMATFYYQLAIVERDQTVKHALPNKATALREIQAKQELQLEKLRKTQGPALDQKRTHLAKQRHDFARNVDRLAKLNKDRDALTVRAPMDGIVYYGKFHLGQWTLSDSLRNRLVVHGVVNHEETIMTVVKARPTSMRVSVDEKDAHWFKPGLQGTARMAFQPDRKLSAKVASAAPVPSAPGQFAVEITLDLGDADFVPGMAAAVKFVPYSKKAAIAIPASCVHEEDDKSFVYVLVVGKEVRREVTIGPSDGDRIEIVSGLGEHDEVLLERKAPSGKKGATP